MSLSDNEKEEIKQQAAIFLSVVQEFSEQTFEEVDQVPVSEPVVNEVSNETKS